MAEIKTYEVILAVNIRVRLKTVSHEKAEEIARNIIPMHEDLIDIQYGGSEDPKKQVMTIHCRSVEECS